jgi:hypothetical protein
MTVTAYKSKPLFPQGERGFIFIGIDNDSP